MKTLREKAEAIVQEWEDKEEISVRDGYKFTLINLIEAGLAEREESRDSFFSALEDKFGSG